ncbi:MAG: PLP-dependent aminotransferase family protein [Cyclobacteriaceae bacterium]|nr:PLP-dependent aminotransferase family protein [Cyclobacteriaceae bacterium HetDA_MAG_MS6]
MMPFASLIEIDRQASLPVFVQIGNALTMLIENGTVSTGAKLPGTRAMSELLGVHRKTVVAAYDELVHQGWIEMIPAKGAFVRTEFPVSQPEELINTSAAVKDAFGTRFYSRDFIIRHDLNGTGSQVVIDEGVPDVRLVPTKEVSRAYRRVINGPYHRELLGYGSLYGDDHLRDVLVKYLHESRGLNITTNNILITRGSQMGLHLAAQLLLRPGDKVLVGQDNYITATHTLMDTGADVIDVPVDQSGVDMNAVRGICETQNVKAIYITPHHHHPTTVTLSANRRIQLLQLAEEFDMAILEDDYDYDFHYNRSPLLPLASADRAGRVVYMGGISKIIAPALRIGYLVAAEDFIEEAARYRRLVDRQGDAILERAIAEMFKLRDIQRLTKKSLRIYRKRRDLFADMLRDMGCFDFKVPDGGMAFWAGLDPSIDWDIFHQMLLENGLQVPYWRNYDLKLTGHNFLRMGFASINEEEIEMAGSIMKRTLRKLKTTEAK